MAIKKAKIFTITSVKGGTGKTTIAINLAGLLSLRKIKTIIVDLDLNFGVVAPTLNVQAENDIYDLVNDITNNKFDQIDNYVSKYNEYIDILPAPKDLRSAYKIDPKYISTILNKLGYKYDVILIDTNHIIDGVNLVTYDASDQIIYIMTSDLMDIRNMKNMVTIYEDMKNNNYKIVLNDAISHENSPKRIENILEHPINYIIPKSSYIKNIEEYVMKGKIATLEEKKKEFKLNKLLDDLLK